MLWFSKPVPFALFNLANGKLMIPAARRATRAIEIDTSVPDLGQRFLQFLGEKSYPCVGAKSALTRGSIETHVFGRLGDRANDQLIVDGLAQFVAMIEANDCDTDIVYSYVAIFRGPFDMDEFRFEYSMWSQLWRLHKLDKSMGNLPADDVSSDPGSPRFSLSVAGHPFFLIGLHPNASRLARRFSNPVLVFNSHRQFEKLRADGRFIKMQAATRLRDIELQGSINPNLANFGAASEARQYSGRKVKDNWRCPFNFERKP
jgi:uncharacterized protein